MDQTDPLFSRSDGFAHAYPLKTQESYEMLASKSPNLFGESFYPPQKLWLLNSNKLSGQRDNWTKEPVEIIEANQGEPWYGGGFFWLKYMRS